MVETAPTTPCLESGRSSRFATTLHPPSLDRLRLSLFYELQVLTPHISCLLPRPSSELTERLSQRSQGVLKHIRSSTLGTAPANPKEAQTLSKIASEFDKVQALQHEKIVLAERLSLLVEKHTRRLASDVLQRVADLGGVEKPVVPPLVLTAPTSVRKVERAGGGAGGGGAEGLGAMAAVGTPGHHQPSVMAMPPPASTERGDNKSALASLFLSLSLCLSLYAASPSLD